MIPWWYLYREIKLGTVVNYIKTRSTKYTGLHIYRCYQLKSHVHFSQASTDSIPHDRRSSFSWIGATGEGSS